MSPASIWASSPVFCSCNKFVSSLERFNNWRCFSSSNASNSDVPKSVGEGGDIVFVEDFVISLALSLDELELFVLIDDGDNFACKDKKSRKHGSITFTKKNITVVFEICGLEDVDVSFDLMSLSRLVDFELNDSLSVWPRRLEYGEGLRL